MLKKILIVVAVLSWIALGWQVTNYLSQLDKELSYENV